MSTIRKIIIGVAIVILSRTSFAGEITGLTTFTAGTTAKASEVNGNFSAVKSAVDDNASDISALQATVASLQSQLASAMTLVDELSEKLEHVSVTTSADGYPTLLFEGVNVQVVNGEGSTDSANGTGNLIVGYNEPKSATNRFGCTIGWDNSTGFIGGIPITDQTGCEDAGGTWTNTSFKTGSHYVVVGPHHNYSRWGGIVAGETNISNFDYASVLGGAGNVASAEGAAVSGGQGNTASGSFSSVSGGTENVASGIGTIIASSVSGGNQNTASGNRASISGGAANTASGSSSSVSGGSQNTASGPTSAISGGSNRTVTGPLDWAAGSLFEDQ